MEVSKTAGSPGSPVGGRRVRGQWGAGGGQYLSFPSSQEVPPAQPLRDFPILEVEEMEPLPVPESPQTPARLDSGYEKHFLPTPEELGLLGPPPGPKFWPEPTPGQETGAQLTDEDTEDQGG